MKKKVKLIAACAFAAIAVLAAVPAAMMQKTEPLQENTPAVEQVAPVAVLRQGSRGGEVKEMQRRLKQ